LDVKGLIKSYVRDYLFWKHSLPFVIPGREEMGLLVHRPSSDLRGAEDHAGERAPSAG